MTREEFEFGDGGLADRGFRARALPSGLKNGDTLEWKKGNEIWTVNDIRAWSNSSGEWVFKTLQRATELETN